MERLLLTAKRMGFSIEETRMLTVSDLIVLADLMAPDPDSDAAPRARRATQEDIDRFMR